MSPPRARVAQEASSALAGVPHGVASGAGAVPVPLRSARVRPPLEPWAQLWAPHGQRDTEGLERVQSRAGAGGAQPGEEGAGGARSLPAAA